MTPFGFTPGGSDDPSQDPDFAEMMRAMQEQMKEQFEKLGMNSPGFVNPLAALFSQNPAATAGKQEALPQTMVRDTAKKVVTTKGSMPLGTKDLSVVSNAFEISEIWLNEATSFPATVAAVSAADRLATSRLDWVDTTLPGWITMMEPLASGLAAAISDLLDQAVAGQEGTPEMAETPPIEMISMVLRSFIGTMIATQLGQSIGTLATEVTGAHDVGLPLITPARPLLIPENIENWSKDLEIAKSEIFIFHALREGAVARLFAHNPWLVSYIQSAIVEYGKGIHIDIEAISRQAEEAFEKMQENSPSLDGFAGPDALTFSLDSGVFTPEESPAQKVALQKLETVLALIDGWSDDVVALAAGDRLPSLEQLRETLRRRRATSAPAQQLFSSLLGLQVSPKLSREASAFWRKIREIKSVEDRDQIWSSLLPSAEDLLQPEAFLASTSIPDDLSGLI
jgi:putative hydrolase